MSRRSYSLDHVLFESRQYALFLFQLLLLAQCLTHYEWAINIYGINWTSCCLPPAPKHLFSEVAFSRRKVEEVVHNHCFYFAKRMQTVHQVELFSTHTNAIAPSNFLCQLTPFSLLLGTHWGSVGHLSPSMWFQGKEGDVPVPVNFLLLLSL